MRTHHSKAWGIDHNILNRNGTDFKHECTCCYTVSQGHDNFDILRPELMNGLHWLGEWRELGAVEVNLTSHQVEANQQRNNHQRLANSSETHSFRLCR